METVELKDFIRSTLVQIASGIKEANADVKERHGQFGPFTLRSNIGDTSRIPGISFDIAVVATKDQKDKAGFMIALVSIAGGASTEKGFGGETAHRIKFEIGVRNEVE